MTDQNEVFGQDYVEGMCTNIEHGYCKLYAPEYLYCEICSNILEVYHLLWELFYNQSPFIKNHAYMSYGIHNFRKLMDIKEDEHQLFDILFSILPGIIDVNKDRYVLHIAPSGYVLQYLDMAVNENNEFYIKNHIVGLPGDNIWLSLKSLLVELKKRIDAGDKIEFVWRRNDET